MEVNKMQVSLKEGQGKGNSSTSGNQVEMDNLWNIRNALILASTAISPGSASRW